MGRGKRDVTKTRRILLKILSRLPFKQIAFEEGTSVPYLSQIKSEYIDETISLKLNSKGIRIMNEEQLTLPLHRTTVLRVDHRLRHSSRRSRRRKSPRSLV